MIRCLNWLTTIQQFFQRSVFMLLIFYPFVIVWCLFMGRFYIMKGKFKQWWTTIPLISTKHIFTSDLNSPNTKKTMSYDIVIRVLTITKKLWIKLTSNNILVCVKWFTMRARCSLCCYKILVELLTIIHNKCKYVCYAILYLFSKYIQNADLALF